MQLFLRLQKIMVNFPTHQEARITEITKRHQGVTRNEDYRHPMIRKIKNILSKMFLNHNQPCIKMITFYVQIGFSSEMRSKVSLTCENQPVVTFTD